MEDPATAILDSIEFPDSGKVPTVLRFDYKKIAERKISELEACDTKKNQSIFYRDRKVEGLNLQMILDRFKFYSSFFELPQINPRNYIQIAFCLKLNESKESCIYISFLQRY